MERAIGVGEYIISNNVEDALKIYGLASCIGLVMYCPRIKVLGVAHILLPSSKTNLELSVISPAYFADTGVIALVNEICSTYYAKKEELVVQIYGGAEARTRTDIFNIGSRNILAVKDKLNEYKLEIQSSHVGGDYSRTLLVRVNNGVAELNLQKMKL